jgi:general secretion pathway protein K
MSGRRSERGLALVVALWGVAALALIAAAMLSSAVNTARIDRNAWQQLQVQTAADSGVQSAILSLFDPTHAQLLDGRERILSSADIAVTVSVLDETGRIDINYANRALLRDFFKAAGASDADTLADRIVDWRSHGETRSANGATADDYRSAGYAWHPRGCPFQSVDELGLVMGMTPELLGHAEQGLTVYSHIQGFDTRFAPRDVLRSIPGTGEHEVDEMVAARLPVAATAGHAYSIVATAVRHHMRFTRRAVVLISADPASPYLIEDWK